MHQYEIDIKFNFTGINYWDSKNYKSLNSGGN